MSEEILKALMQMFAIVIRQDDDEHERYDAFVLQFLSSQLSPALVPQYLRLYEAYKNEGREKHKENKLTPVIDSVRILSICKRINKTLNTPQKAILMVRLLELIALEGKPSRRRLDIANTAAAVFRLDGSEYRQMQVFIDYEGLSHELDPADLLIICSPQEEDCNYCHQPYVGISDGLLYVLNLNSVNLQFVRYKGGAELLLNGLNMLSGKVYLFPPGSIIKVPGGKPLFYSDILSRIRQDVMLSPIRFSAENISLQYPGGMAGVQTLSIKEREGRLVGIMGASGSGKSTLLNILSGIQKPDSGSIQINGLDIYKDRAALRGVAGYIPQDDLLMEDLSVFENLYFNARLCFDGLEEAQLVERVNSVMNSLGITAFAELKVGNPVQKTISGGQRKRLNIGIELLREPSVLFVDEPTSGLSSRDSENVMDLLRELTLKGKLIFVVIHQPSSDIYKLFDRMLMMDMGGVLIYDGNPIEAVEYFRMADRQADLFQGSCPHCGHVSPEHIFNIIEARIVDEYGHYTTERKRKPSDWRDLFLKQETHEISFSDVQKPVPEFRAPGRWKQTLIYATRDLRGKLRNRQYMMLNLLEAPLLAFILSFIIRYTGGYEHGIYSFSQNDNIPAYLFMCILVATFLGLTVSAEEIFRDRRILKREKLLRMSRISYLCSKTLLLFVLSGIQAFLFTLIGNAVLGIEDMTIAYWAVFFSVSCLSNVMGLLISASMNSVVTIYVLVPLLIIPQMILGGAMFSFEKLNTHVGGGYHVPLPAVLMPSRWAYEALAVKQFKDSRYGRLVYDWAALESRAGWRHEYLYPELTKIIAEFHDARLTGDADKAKKRLQLLSSTLEPLLKQRFGDTAVIPENPAEWTRDETLAALEKIKKISAYDRELLRRAGIKKEEILKTRGGVNTNSEGVDELLNHTHNIRLAEVVRRLDEERKIIRTEDKIICLMDPVYMETLPTIGLSMDAHFFAPYKYVFGYKVSTFRFNLMILWFLTFTLFAMLYFNALKWMMNGFSSFVTKFQHLFRKIMKKFLLKPLWVSSVLMVFSSCGGEMGSGGIEQELMGDTGLADIAVSEEVINTIVEAMPAPLEMSATLKSAGAGYSPTLLSPVSEADAYTFVPMKAFGLGRYVADLAYLNIYEKPNSAIGYLNVIKKLADDLMIGPFFDFQLLRRLSCSNRNMDSLLYISTRNFNAMDRHLRDKKRVNLSVLMVAGAWMEGIYIASSVAVETRHKMIVEKVGEQKVILDQLMIILGAYERDAFFKTLKDDFSELHEVFREVEIKTEYREPGSSEENGKLVIVDHSVTTILVPDSTLLHIHRLISGIRKRHSSGKL